jgi:parvulin-like peptidyl-prolyl isomerase
MVLAVGLAVAVGGCGMFSAHSDVVEQAAGQKFTSQQLADFLDSVKGPIRLDAQTGNLVTALWTDMTLFAQAAADNKLTTDSAFVAEAMWPMIAQATAARWIDTVVTRKAKISDASVDSAYNADQARAVQHILIAADSGAPKAVRDAARQKIEGILTQLKGGASFSKLAFERTEDPGSKADSGYYPPQPKGKYVPSFEKSLWSLKPGEMSGVITTSYGYHILRRPTETESARWWRDSLSRATATKITEAYFTDLNNSDAVKLDANAVARMRSSLDDFDDHANDGSAIATYKGGEFTTADFVHWMRALTSDPFQGQAQLTQLKTAPDSIYRKFAQTMVQEDLMLKDAAKNGIHLQPAEWKDLQTGFAAAVDTAKQAIGLTPQVLDPKLSTGDRERAAQAKVTQFFNDMATQKAQPRPLPGVLAATLRARSRVKFNAVAMEHGLDLARTKRTADSLKTAGKPGANAAPGAIAPAPSGPPLPSGDTGKAGAPKKP